LGNEKKANGLMGRIEKHIGFDKEKGLFETGIGYTDLRTDSNAIYATLLIADRLKQKITKNK
jgi:hypothetical protein